MTLDLLASKGRVGLLLVVECLLGSTFGSSQNSPRPCTQEPTRSIAASATLPEMPFGATCSLTRV